MTLKKLLFRYWLQITFDCQFNRCESIAHFTLHWIRVKVLTKTRETLSEKSLCRWKEMHPKERCRRGIENLTQNARISSSSHLTSPPPLVNRLSSFPLLVDLIDSVTFERSEEEEEGTLIFFDNRKQSVVYIRQAIDSYKIEFLPLHLPNTHNTRLTNRIEDKEEAPKINEDNN